ncbi:hypothetical protein PENTCL1PPCAC_25388 [Pristionchus entomophagus]|uniref:C2H2-type domain-containing protein n=1 Tax=Pristionchus entomophagus TaxID=358040 RepID=A0AAV5U8M0_9BILA|nr:hypothetical protein PENTCL1PPCAC_25388 [Pristionchus entomophagus]
MPETTPGLNCLPAAHTPLQPTLNGEGAAAAADSSPLFKNSPWAFLPTQATLFSSLRAETTFGAPQPTADYEKQVIEWVPPTPASDSSDHSSAPAAAAWESPAPAAGLPRPQPQMPQDNGVSLLAAVPSPQPAMPARSESPIDVVSTSAFAPVDQSGAVPKQEEASQEIVRPQPMRVDSMDASSINPLLILASDSSQQQHQQQLQQPTVTLASAFGLNPDTIIMSAEPGPSSSSASEQNVSPPSRGCYTRAPGLGPPSETPTSGNGQTSAYVCAVCGFSCASKFHYNSHMNTHGDHQCTMCDYTSRTEGRLKKHMRDSHTVEEQLAAGLELAPPPAAAAASSANTTPTKDAAAASMEVDVPSDAAPAPDPMPSPSSLSQTLLGLIATSQAGGTMSLSALEQMRAITEQPLLGDGSNEGLLLVGTPLGLGLPMKEEGSTGGGGGRRKMKIYKCKQCHHLSQTKDDQWAHARTHIPADKQMSCTLCNFVTEYKHHLEYHLRNHAGTKPFQCKKCNYTCVNKSMLNSHMKSHSNVYHFRCADCNYATKYCHSLKLHLKKYGHRRNTEGLTEAELLASLSAESSPPSMRKDSTTSIASSLSGPFTPFGLIKREEPTTPLATPQMPSFSLPQSLATSQSLTYATQMLLRQHQMEQMMQAPAHKCYMCEFTCGTQEELMRHNMNHFLNGGNISNIYQALNSINVQATLGIPDRSAEDDHHTTTGSPSGDDAVSHSNGSAGSPLGSARGSGDEGEGGACRRKSTKPSRIDDIGLHLINKASPDPVKTEAEEEKADEAMDTTDSGNDASATVDIAASPEQLVLPAPRPLQPLQHLQQQQQLMGPAPGGLLAAVMTAAAAPQLAAGGMPGMDRMRQAYLARLTNQIRPQQREQFRFECHHCPMGFADHNIHTLHMSYHSLENPMQCSKCGLVCTSVLHFNIHLLQSCHI